MIVTTILVFLQLYIALSSYFITKKGSFKAKLKNYISFITYAIISMLTTCTQKEIGLLANIELRKVSTKKYPDGKIYPEGSSPTLSDNQRTLKIRDARTV